MKPQPSFFIWKGFEIYPEGSLLEQVIDLSGSMGVAYERSLDFYKDFHIHDRLMFVFPRGSSVMEIRTRPSSREWSIDQNSLLIVPKHIVHDDEGKSAIYDTLALYPDEPLLKSALKTLTVSKPRAQHFSSYFSKFPRTSWLSHLLEEYFFRRIMKSTSEITELKFFEKEITLEVIRIALDIKKPQSHLNAGSKEKVPDRAIQFIENHLFEKLPLERIGRESAMSISTLLREFKKMVGKTPAEYIQHRRLDEAKNLLKKGNHSVGEVAILVGYQNFGAFSEAFKRRFGNPPSQVH